MGASEPSLTSPSLSQPGEKLPYKASVCWLIAWFFGPLAGAIVTFISLRRIGLRRQADWTLRLTILGCALYFVASMKSSYFAETIHGWRQVVWMVPGLLYFILVKGYLEEWQPSPAAAPAGAAWSLLWGVIGLVSFAALFLIVFVGLSVAWPFPRDINVRVSAPQAVSKGSPFVFTVELENTAERPEWLESITLDRDFFKSIDVLRADPPFNNSTTLLFGTHSYEFQKTVSAKSKLQIQFQGQAREPGECTEEIRVCMNVPSRCKSLQATIAVKD
jgi:hypothetical protein